MLKVGNILNGKYEILRLLGKGGMSTVWLAMDLNINRQWAIKEISKEDPKYKLTVNEKKTLSEIEIMRKLDHPALPRIVDVIDEEYTLFVIMDYIEGETLLNILEMYGVQSEEIVVSWMLEVCDILTYLHSQNPPIIYRDIKPSNIMLNKDGHIKIIDFGIAREYKGGKNDTMPLGTKGYASPEHSTQNTDARSDVYTVGATTYQLLTGKNPEDPPYTIQPIRSVNPELSQGLEKIVLKATRQNPNERYQTAAEMANAFESYKKLDDAYIEKLKSKIDRFKKQLIISVSIIGIGLLLTAGGFIAERNSYNNLVESPGGSLSIKEENLTRAISLRPKEEAAYLALIQAYAEDGKFTEEESSKFFSIYNDNKTSISSDTSYAIGEAYLRYYTGETDNSARAKLITAEPFFTASIKSKYSEAAKSYVFLAECYRNYVMSDDSLLTKDVTKEELESLLKTGKNAVSNAKNDKMIQIVGEAVLSLIDQKKLDFRDTGIPESEVISVIHFIEISSEGEIKKLARETEKSVKAAYLAGKKKGG